MNVTTIITTGLPKLTQLLKLAPQPNWALAKWPNRAQPNVHVQMRSVAKCPNRARSQMTQAGNWSISHWSFPCYIGASPSHLISRTDGRFTVSLISCPLGYSYKTRVTSRTVFWVPLLKYLIASKCSIVGTSIHHTIQFLAGITDRRRSLSCRTRRPGPETAGTGNNRYGRKGRSRCLQCRKWRQKVYHFVKI